MKTESTGKNGSVPILVKVHRAHSIAIKILVLSGGALQAHILEALAEFTKFFGVAGLSEAWDQ